MENTTHDITVGGQKANGHTAKPVDPNNPPKREKKEQAPAPAKPAAPKPAPGN